MLYKLFEWISCGNLSFSVCNDLSSTSIFVESTCTAFSIDSSTFSSPSFPVSAEELSTAEVIVFCRLISLSYQSTEFLLFSSVLWVKENIDGHNLENLCHLIACLNNKILKCYRNEQENYSTNHQSFFWLTTNEMLAAYSWVVNLIACPIFSSDCSYPPFSEREFLDQYQKIFYDN